MRRVQEILVRVINRKSTLHGIFVQLDLACPILINVVGKTILRYINIHAHAVINKSD